MDIGEKFTPASRAEWRDWLAEHHQEKSEIWLVLYKSTSGKQGLTMSDAQEEALCFGWIDSNLKPVDEISYALRFSPRRDQKKWSEVNKKRVIRLLREGKMAPAGIALLPPDILQAWEEENTTKSS